MKNFFKIIPVLDLKDGIVVHGVKGERAKYLPIKSNLTASVEFPQVLEAFIKNLGVGEFYIADLDAIMCGRKKNQLSLIFPKERHGLPPLNLMIDAGVTDRESAAEIINAGADKVIVGTETLSSLKTLADIIEAYGTSRIAVSIDIMDMKILSPAPEIYQLTPVQAIKEISRAGATQFILLELHRVGTGTGINKPLIKVCLDAVKEANASGSLIIGGGVSGYEDLKWLAENGVDGALVASVLHNGLVNGDLIRALERIN